MLARIPMALFHEWIEFEELEPSTHRCVDAHLALIACILANAHRDRRRQRRPFDVKRFLLSSESRQTKRQTPEQMKAVLRAFTNVHRDAMKRRKPNG